MNNVVQGKKTARPLISFCIPTFNRCEKVYKLVNSILQSKNEEFEVIVLDNCSTDNTATLLTQIKDPRFFFIENEKNIGGLLNPLKVLASASGNYAFLILDKDWVDITKINDLITRLNADTDIIFGRCGLNLKDAALDITYNKGSDSVFNMAYLSQHPTGFFYKTEIYKELPILDDIFANPKIFGFYFDLINAEVAVLGKSKVINLPAFYTEDKDDCKDVPSFTYTEKDVFFSPGRRLIELDLYLDSAKNLQLANRDLLKLIWIIYTRTLISATFFYKSVLADKALCAHYQTNPRKVGNSELWKICFTFSSYLMKKKLPIGYLGKLYIVIYGYIKFLVKSILNSIK